MSRPATTRLRRFEVCSAFSSLTGGTTRSVRLSTAPLTNHALLLSSFWDSTCPSDSRDRVGYAGSGWSHSPRTKTELTPTPATTR